MVYCLNPDCEKPLNPDPDQRCQCCGRSLDLLRNRYKILKPLGQGGFGKTYLAEDIDNFNELCVVKQLICPAQGKQVKKKFQLFLREAKQLQRLKENPQIPGLLAYFEENHHPYLVQEFVDGQNLQQEVDIEGNFTEEKIYSLLLEILPILHAIHQQGVIHRDLKPTNIMRRYADHRLILIDFGIAKQDSISKLMLSGTTLGTEGFAPLEQFVEGKVCPASDLFSLGVCCFNLLTGISPDHLKNLHGYSWVNEWQRHLLHPINNALVAIIDKLLRIKLSERFVSAQEVLEALTSISVKSQLTWQSSLLPNSQRLSHLPDKTVIDFPTRCPSSLAVPSPNSDLQTFRFEVMSVDSEGQIIDRQQSHGHQFVEILGDDMPLEMVAIPGGEFLMGSAASDPQRFDDEGPQHTVSVSPFYIGKFLVTQTQWQKMMGSNPSSFRGAERPVEQVSWQEAMTFCQRLAQVTGRPYRLPSESEWEYACRAQTTTPFAFGETITPQLANYDRNHTYDSGPKGQYRKQTSDVGSFPANAFGLYDMHGNVWEWCQDSWHDSYQGSPTDGGNWQEKDSSWRVLRGGSWIYSPRYCRSAARYYVSLDCRNFYIGFRVVMSALSK